MFQSSIKIVRESVYGVMCKTPMPNNQVTCGMGTAFMIAPGICVTAAHVLHLNNDKTQPLYSNIEVIRSPDIGSSMTKATLIAEDINRDIAFIKLSNPSNSNCVKLVNSAVPAGTSVGTIGFPLSSVLPMANGRLFFNLQERFQGAFVSCHKTEVQPNYSVKIYETDSLMYNGSSGCPAFNVDGEVIGIHVAVLDQNINNVTSRLSISFSISAEEIIQFAQANGISVSIA